VTRHGTQALDPRLRKVPTSYHHTSGPIGQVFRVLRTEPRLDRVAVIGLGAGALAAYGRPGQRMTFYEIDPEVVRIARHSTLFTYLQDSEAEIEYVIGDGRLTLARAPDGEYGLIVVDAFSSDAIPVHLMTREAIEVYFRKLRPDGVLALQLTNQYLGLEPVVDALARDLGLVGLVQWDQVRTRGEGIVGKDPSTWALLARSPGAFGALGTDPRWTKLPTPGAGEPNPEFLWTDDYSNVWSVLRGF
jgi:SAM-dependent methyltransferase